MCHMQSHSGIVFSGTVRREAACWSVKDNQGTVLNLQGHWEREDKQIVTRSRGGWGVLTWRWGKGHCNSIGCWFPCFLCILFGVLGIEPRVVCMLSMCSTTELCPQLVTSGCCNWRVLCQPLIVLGREWCCMTADVKHRSHIRSDHGPETLVRVTSDSMQYGKSFTQLFWLQHEGKSEVKVFCKCRWT